MHVNKANRGRQERRKKATKREMVGGKTHKPYEGRVRMGEGVRKKVRAQAGEEDLRRGAVPERGALGGSGHGGVDADGLGMEGWGHREWGTATEQRRKLVER